MPLRCLPLTFPIACQRGRRSTNCFSTRSYSCLKMPDTWAGRSAGSPAVGQALRRRLAFFVAPLVTVFLPTVLR